MYGGDDALAAKVAGNELQSLLWFFNTSVETQLKRICMRNRGEKSEGRRSQKNGNDNTETETKTETETGTEEEEEEDRLSFPLMALLDFRGFRLICMTLLPISSSTLVYGSNDAGRTIRASDERMNKQVGTFHSISLLFSLFFTLFCQMKKLAEALNLREHICGVLDPDEAVSLYHATDLEGHLGVDGRLYALDFARAFPCEFPTRLPSGKLDPTSHLVNLFRPEFVKVSERQEKHSLSSPSLLLPSCSCFRSCSFTSSYCVELSSSLTSFHQVLQEASMF
jgi:hypothetical protein